MLRMALDVDVADALRGMHPFSSCCRHDSPAVVVFEVLVSGSKYIAKHVDSSTFISGVSKTQISL